MSIIELKEANCRNCYKCIRNCALKAISFHNDEARILSDDCVLCGTCALICPQNAKKIKSSADRVLSEFEKGRRVYASVAPSYAAAFPGMGFDQFKAALMAAGFAGAEETSIGAAAVSEEYTRLMREGGMKNIITSCCPSVNMLVEKYFPELKIYLAPVATPATAHARMLKKVYGDDILVAFIGPCISKKYEAEQGKDIFAALMFEELEKLLEGKGATIAQGGGPRSARRPDARLYPLPGGIIETVPEAGSLNYKTEVVSGLDRCISALKDLQDNPDCAGHFREMSACDNSCVSGPGMQYKAVSFFMANERIHADAKAPAGRSAATEGISAHMSAAFEHVRIRSNMPDERTIAAILASIGKTSPESMLNCGTCGYDSCRDKAIAVFQGKANLSMCLPYMREHAESLSNVIIEATPNALILIDGDWSILQYNRAAQATYGIDESQGVGYPATLYLPARELEEVQSTQQRVTDRRVSVCDDKRVVIQTVLPVQNGDYLIVGKDVTDQEATHRRMEDMRREMLETAQNVIDKQMRAAQEIASLLGETTGESKAALIALKKSIMRGE